MEFLWCILLGYFVGAINPSYILAKVSGLDIRKNGSGNAGASNAVIVLGKIRGLICALFDIAKAAVVVWVARDVLFPKFAYSYAVTSVSCVLGHIFPFYMMFKGGKGLACLGGMILTYDWRVFLLMFAGEIGVLLITKYICFVPMTAIVVFPVIYGVMMKDLWGALILCILIPVMIYKHSINLKRIKNGTELRISYLWNKEKEIERLKKNGRQDMKLS